MLNVGGFSTPSLQILLRCQEYSDCDFAEAIKSELLIRRAKNA